MACSQSASVAGTWVLTVRCCAWHARRKKKAVHKTTSTDDKRLQNTLKRLGVNTIPGIEEVNIFKEDSVIHFTNPKGAREAAGAATSDACMPPRGQHAAPQRQQRHIAGGEPLLLLLH